MEQEINYIREYYKAKEHDLTTLLSCGEIEEEKIKEIKKQINQLQKQINEKSLEIHNILDKFYTKQYIPINNKICIEYQGRNGNYYFDFDSGIEIEDLEDNYITHTIYNKSGEIIIVVGYNYEMASIIMKKYKYNISSKNDRITIKLLEEIVIDFLSYKVAIKNLIDNTTKEDDYISWEYKKILDKTNNEFVNKLFNIDYKGSYTLGTLIERQRNNKSFEIIIKTAPKEIVDKLLKMEVESAIPIHKIIGVSLETYNKAIELGIIEKVFVYKDYINGSLNEELGINKTEKEWLEFIDSIKTHEEDLQFYNIDYSNGYYYDNEKGLFGTLLSNYKEYSVLREYYTLGKFVNYVINETINQGYNKVRDFIIELKDYLTMCKHDNIRPTLYSSYLRQTHDITSRNHKVIVEKENEEIFISRYKDFKEYISKDKEYMIIALKNSNDLKKEGDTLNHCVASYIKRVIDNECMILFLRKDREESLITIEIRLNTICQVRGLHNRKPTENEIKVLREFANERDLEINF